MKVLCFGSLNIDYRYKVEHFVKKGETLSSDGLQVFSGGKGLNQSIALARAGVEVYHAGSIGDDGQFLLKELQKANVDTRYVTIRTDVRTGNAIIQNDREGDNCILLYGGANLTVTKEQVDEVFGYFGRRDYLVIQNEINALDYIIQQAHKKGMKIVLNPSPMNEKILSLPLENVDYFLLNEIEAGQILEKDVFKNFDGRKLAEELLLKFPGAAIILTMGRDGAVYMDGKETIVQPVFNVQAVDTTAAGDTFTGFFIGEIIRGCSVGEAMAVAAKAAAIAVTRQGAAPSIPCLDEVECFRTQQF